MSESGMVKLKRKSGFSGPGECATEIGQRQFPLLRMLLADFKQFKSGRRGASSFATSE